MLEKNIEKSGAQEQKRRESIMVRGGATAHVECAGRRCGQGLCSFSLLEHSWNAVWVLGQEA